MDDVSELKRKITSIRPLHDTPMGRIHPYWARKPLNIIRELIKGLSQEGDTICDPFMGCGTTAFGCLLENRNIIATDINPLTSLIVQGTLSLCQDPMYKMQTLTKFVETFEKTVNKWFVYGNGNTIERERYFVCGEFENGNFELVPYEIILRVGIGPNFNGKRIARYESEDSTPAEFGTLLNSPINFKKCKLAGNSRIAIPRGALLSHYFTNKNIACINSALSLIDKGQYDHEMKTILRFFLSSALPLLRLSDYKASSQWPYWRPKNRLTSRNPVFVFRRRLHEFQRAQEWLSSNALPFILTDQLSCMGKENKLTAAVNKISVQELKNHLVNSEVDLILTDPPYGDHVPYLEYSSLWNHILGLSISKEDFKNEIVKTDSKRRQIHNSQYINKLLLGLEVCAQILKTEGYLVWFYQDPSIDNWYALYKKSQEVGLRFLTVIPLPKQRRSIKTITSPGKTFDGDLILIFQKMHNEDRACEKSGVAMNSEMSNTLVRITNFGSSFFNRYAELIQESFEQGWIDKLSEKYSNIREIIK